jgi:hypothetical protein
VHVVAAADLAGDLHECRFEFGGIDAIGCHYLHHHGIGQYLLEARFGKAFHRSNSLPQVTRAPLDVGQGIRGKVANRNLRVGIGLFELHQQLGGNLIRVGNGAPPGLLVTKRMLDIGMTLD